MKEIIIQVKDLTKSYGEFEAVRGISFEVYKGEIFGLLGPNGAGKSTTLEIIETLRQKSGGTVIVDGMNLDTDPEAIKKIIGVDLVDKAKSKFKELSGGQKQRFSIATTLINRPKIIFLDEPTTGLDPQARRNLWDLILEIRNNGTTVIITTHYMDEAEVLCDRVAIIDSGKIIGINSPNQLIDELVASGFEKEKEVKMANLEDVFIHMTGKQLREA